MAILKNTTISGTGQITIPSGSTVSRPYVRPVLEVFTDTGSTTWTAPATVNKVEVLVVAGGGGGGRGYYGGGGGAGGVVYRDEFAVTPSQSYTVTVGAGGAKGPNETTNGSNGGNSVFGTLTALGGGGGSSRTAGSNGLPGGSGGGSALPGQGGGAATQPGSASGGFGNPGAGNNNNGNDNTYGSGGGGAGQPGQAGALPYNNGPRQNTSLGAPGGDGLDFSFMVGKDYGENGFFAGGGAGGSRGTGEPVTGGYGGGGDGGEIGGSIGQNGAINTGGGGGGGGDASQAGGDGGSGFVAIRYYLAEDNVEPEGLIRFNTDINELEVYEGSARGWTTQDPNKNFAGGNFLRHTLDYSNAVWNKTNGSTFDISTVVDPDGNRNAIEWRTTTGGSYSRLRQDFSAVSGRFYTFSLYVKRKPGEYQYCMVYLNWYGQGAYFDVENGTYVGRYTSGASEIPVHEIYPAGDGWWQIVCGAPVSTTGTRYPELFIHNNAVADITSHIADTTSGRGMYTYGWSLQEFVGNAPAPFTATYDVAAPTPVTGATHTVHEFTTVGSSGFRPSFTGNVELLIVGGGGGGGARGGGGGAGGLIYKTDYPVIAGKQYKVTVGNGGVGSSSTTAGNPNQMGTNGQDSRFGDLVAVGGGGGGGFDQAGRHGGSGGGCGRDAEDGTKNQPGRGIEGQGHRGGFSGNYGSTTNVGCSGAGGGGGAGGPGGNGTTRSDRSGGTIVLTTGEWGGNGGPGLPISITGSTRYYAGGGGGGNGCRGTDSAIWGVGGVGGGGDGNDSGVRTATAGEANTGGGGGGGGDNPQTSAQGGSGIVIIRYKHQ